MRAALPDRGSPVSPDEMMQRFKRCLGSLAKCVEPDKAGLLLELC